LPGLQIAAPAIAVLSITLCVLAVVGIFLIPALWPDQEIVPTPQPGYAYVFEGRVTVQQGGGDFEPRGEGDQIQFGPGTFLRQVDGEAGLSLPGGYLLRIAGSPERPTLVEFYQAAGVSNVSTSVLILRDGSLFVYTSSDLETGQSVQIETAAGLAIVNGTTMGTRFDNSTWLFEVDCVTGNCLLSTNLPAELSLEGGQRSFVDASGNPNGPFPVNLDLYKDSYDLEAFIDANIIADVTATYQPPVEDTPTPNPTPTPTLTPTPTNTPLPTWTLMPTQPPSQATSTKPPFVTNTIAATIPSYDTDTPEPTETDAPTEPVSPTETDVPIETTEVSETVESTKPPPIPTDTKFQITLDITLPPPFETPSSGQVMEYEPVETTTAPNHPLSIADIFIGSGLMVIIVFGIFMYYVKKANS
jgi:hypothetical protein